MCDQFNQSLPSLTIKVGLGLSRSYMYHWFRDFNLYNRSIGDIGWLFYSPAHELVSSVQVIDFSPGRTAKMKPVEKKTHRQLQYQLPRKQKRLKTEACKRWRKRLERLTYTTVKRDCCVNHQLPLRAPTLQIQNILN